jgi:hypothetical protein
MKEISREPETKETKPRKTSPSVLIGMIAVAALAFFGIKQIMYYTMLNEEKAKSSAPTKILTDSDLKNAQVKQDEDGI